MSFQIVLKKKYSTLLAIGGLFVICVISFHQLLFSGEIVNATDIITQQYFWNVFIKENLFADPSFRTWLPYVNAGTPFSGGLDLLFRPLSFLTLLIFPVHVAINYEIVMYLFLLGLFMYFFMRETGVSSLSAFLAALFLMLNGEIVSLINAGHVNKIGAIFPTTLVFWAFEHALRRKTLSAFLLTGVALGFEFWQGHVQISYYLCIAIGIYFLVRVGILCKQKKTFAPLRKLTVYALLMVLVFLLLSAVSFLPMLSFAGVSERAQGVSYEFATSWSMPPEELITYFIPGFFGLRRLNYDDDEDIIPYWGRMPFTQTGRYFGLLPLLFMLFALCFVRNKHVLTLAVLALVVLLLGMGKYIPTYQILYNYAPGFNMFRVPQSILFLFAFATSGLAGFGAEWLLSDFAESKEKRLRIFLLVGIAIFLFSWLITIVLPQGSDTLISWFSEALQRKGADSTAAADRLKNIFTGLLQFNVLFGIALFVPGLRLVKHIRLRWFIAAIILMYLGDIWLFNEKYIDTIPIEDSIYISENDAIRYCKTDPGLYRVLPRLNAPATYNVANKYLYHKLYSVSGYEAVGVQYYNEYLRQMSLGTRLVDLLNIKYIILPKGVQFDDQSVEVGNVIGPYKVVMDTDAMLLENLNYLPRAFPVHNAHVLKTRDEIFSTLLHPEFNPGEVVILEENPNVTMSPERIPSSQSHVEITQYVNRTIQLKASMASEGFLVLSEKYYPGWKAYVNGRQTKIYKANYTLQAIFLPKGQYEVLFAYQPNQFIVGFGITMITCISLAGFVMYKKTSQGRLSRNIHIKTEQLLQKIRPIYYSKRLLWGIIAVGILLHTSQYIFNRSLHIDEVSLALNIIDRSFSGLLQPLDSHQGAPIGFLMLEKFLVHLFGNSEYVLRLFPFLSGILAVILFSRVAPYFIRPAGVPVALIFFVLSEQLIIFSSTVKQYSSDVFFALLIFIIAIRLQSKKFIFPEIALFAIIGSVAVFCSHPAVFVLAGVGLSLLLSCVLGKEWGKMGRLVIAGIFWGLSFFIIYTVSLRHLQNDEYLLNFWAGAFLPFPPSSLSEVLWFPKFFIEFAGYAIGLSQIIFHAIQSHSVFKLLTIVYNLITSPEKSPLAVTINMLIFGITWLALYLATCCIAFVGSITIFSRDKQKFSFLIVPICFAFLASVLHKFPLAQRLLLFLIPSAILFLGEGIVQIKKKSSSFTVCVLASLLLAYPLLSANYHLIRPRTDQEIRPVIQYIKEHEQKGDVLYVYYGAQGPFKYYSKRFDFSDKSYIKGVSSRNDWNNYVKDIEPFRGKKRVWLLFSHVFGYEESFFLQYLDRIGGKRLDTIQYPKASAYLYDLSSGSYQ